MLIILWIIGAVIAAAYRSLTSKTDWQDPGEAIPAMIMIAFWPLYLLYVWIRHMMSKYVKFDDDSNAV